MDLAYSATLLASFVCGVVAVLSALVRRTAPDRRPEVWGRWFVWSAIAAGILVVISFVIHLGWGHTPGTPRGLALRDFLREHVSFVVAAGLPLLAWAMRRRT